MAFRFKAKTCARVIFCLTYGWMLWAQTGTYEVRHRHLRNGAVGVLHIDTKSIWFEERGKPKHSFRWTLDDIQELTLGTDTLRIITYSDDRWQLGRDRVYLFDRLPATVATDWYPVFRKMLDRRFVAALADGGMKPEWQIPAKLIRGSVGSQGILLVGTDQVVYRSEQTGESRTWRIADVINVSSSGPFDLTVTTHEREFRFQLKQELPERRYDELWRSVNLAGGLQILGRNNQSGENK